MKRASSSKMKKLNALRNRIRALKIPGLDTCLRGGGSRMVSYDRVPNKSYIAHEGCSVLIKIS